MTACAHRACTSTRLARPPLVLRLFALPLRLAIYLYQKLLSPFLPASCRYYPSCSAYAAEALEIHGAASGSLLAVRRLLRCHPWARGGLDPVPRA